MDPYNLRSEELAIAECARGVEVRRVWSEQEMVRSFDGRMFPGTPDGMFESWDGALTCVQVVRVPLIIDMSPESMQDIIAQTVLTKVVKSQQWLRACHVVPHDFVIFCWLPFTIPDTVAASAELLIQRVRLLDARFSLRLRVPAQPGALFPALFAFVSEARRAEPRGCKSVSEGDVTAFPGSADESEGDEETLPWDITWAWDAEWGGVEPLEEEAAAGQRGGEEEEQEEDAEMEWDITWEWQSDCRVLAQPCDMLDGVLCQQQGAAHRGRHQAGWDDGG